MGVLLQRLLFDSINWVEIYLSHVFVWAVVSSNPRMAWIKQKEKRRENSPSLLEMEQPSSPALQHLCPCFLGFWTWATQVAYLVLQLADGRQWDFLVSIMTWTNFYNKSPYICILFALVLWRMLIGSILKPSWSYHGLLTLDVFIGKEKETGEDCVCTRVKPGGMCTQITKWMPS